MKKTKKNKTREERNQNRIKKELSKLSEKDKALQERYDKLKK